MKNKYENEEKYAKARIFSEMGKLDDVIEILEELLDEDPINSSRYAPFLIDTLIKNKNYEKASYLLTRNIRKHPDEFEYQYRQVKLFYKMDKLGKTRSLIDELKTRENFRSYIQDLDVYIKKIEDKAVTTLTEIDDAVWKGKTSAHEQRTKLESCVTSLLGIKVRYRSSRKFIGLGLDFVFHDRNSNQYHLGITDTNILYVNKVREKVNERGDVIPKGPADTIFKFVIDNDKREMKRVTEPFKRSDLNYKLDLRKRFVNDDKLTLLRKFLFFIKNIHVYGKENHDVLTFKIRDEDKDIPMEDFDPSKEEILKIIEKASNCRDYEVVFEMNTMRGSLNAYFYEDAYFEALGSKDFIMLIKAICDNTLRGIDQKKYY